MVLSGINFAVQYRLFVERRPQRFFGDSEVRLYLGLMLGAALIVAFSLIQQSAYAAGEAFRASLFQVSSIMTTTGFVSADFEAWPSVCQLILLALMFTGGCTGSTAGGLKVARILLLIRVVSRDFKRLAHRHGIFSVRIGDEVIPEPTVQSVVSMVYLAFLVNFTACLLLAATGIDVLTSISAVAACMFNVGPGLGAVGPTEHFGGLPAFAKSVLCVCMLAGRLEFYTALLIFTPAFWRR
jgi:trk system potassium uptake protein TrkH